MTRNLFLLTLIAIFAIVNLGSVPKIDVYVESLCPFCIRFVKGPFKTFLENKDNQKLADITFYSYGNAFEKWNGTHWGFTCQHGEPECFGNMIETCSQKYMTKEESHHFLICMESNVLSFPHNFKFDLDRCLADDQNKHTQIYNCATSKEGSDLLHEVAQKTPSDKQYVPWIVVDGKHDDKVQDQLSQDMAKYLCSIGDNKNLDGCKGYSNTRVLNFLQEPLERCAADV